LTVLGLGLRSVLLIRLGLKQKLMVLGYKVSHARVSLMMASQTFS
jgi:hypothetical protein